MRHDPGAADHRAGRPGRRRHRRHRIESADTIACPPQPPDTLTPGRPRSIYLFRTAADTEGPRACSSRPNPLPIPRPSSSCRGAR
ncbi:putative Predicted protein [Magnetospirillum sp. UT-4]|nr:putative Predicted protein [Magnetospirillum sp. UT-4]